jgi:hypothetical protein
MMLILFYVPSIVCGIHAVRNGQQLYWLFIFAMAPMIGPAVYFFAIMLPELTGGRTARAVGAAARKALDPDREYRLATIALEDTPTVGNRVRLAEAAMVMGRPNEAEPLYRGAAVGQWADDPGILAGHAGALLELGRFQEALARLEEVRALGAPGQTPEVALLFARAYEGLERYAEADDPYRYASDRMAGLEAPARYVACMVKAGRIADARIGLAEIDRRLTKIPSHFKAEARKWRAFAANAVGSG